MQYTESAGGVVINEAGLILIVSQYGKSWSLPKGHLEPGEDALTAARREIYEESGVADLEYVRPLGCYARRALTERNVEDLLEWKTIHMFLFRTRQTELRPIDPENPEARWVGKEDVPGMLTHPRDREFFLGIVSSL